MRVMDGGFSITGKDATAFLDTEIDTEMSMTIKVRFSNFTRDAFGDNAHFEIVDADPAPQNNAKAILDELGSTPSL